MFHKMPFILVAIILLVVFLNPWIPLDCKTYLYGLSLTLKSLIVFLLPFFVFCLLFKTAVDLSKKASKWILFILAGICLSNFISVIVGYFVGHVAYQFDLTIPDSAAAMQLEPAFNILVPKLFENSHAMFCALILGVLLGSFKPTFAEKVALKLEKIGNVILKGFLYVIPVFLIGSMIKMIHEGSFGVMLKNYSAMFALMLATLLAYMFLIYFVANSFRIRGVISSFKNMAPAVIAGFGSMSSAAAMPFTILGTEKNAKNPEVAKAVIPISVNNHLIGDGLAIPIFAFAVMKSFGVSDVSFMSYLVFAFFFVLAKFSAAGVPGGGMIVLLPVLETHMGFNAEMLSLITTIYILFDPIITSANILGNGGFAMILGRLFKKGNNTVKKEVY